MLTNMTMFILTHCLLLCSAVVGACAQDIQACATEAPGVHDTLPPWVAAEEGQEQALHMFQKLFLQKSGKDSNQANTTNHTVGKEHADAFQHVDAASLAKADKQGHGQKKEESLHGQKKEENMHGQKKEESLHSQKKEEHSHSQKKEDSSHGQKKEGSSRDQKKEESLKGQKNEDSLKSQKKEETSKSQKKEAGLKSQKKEQTSKSQKKEEGLKGQKKEENLKSQKKQEKSDDIFVQQYEDDPSFLGNVAGDAGQKASAEKDKQPVEDEKALESDDQRVRFRARHERWTDILDIWNDGFFQRFKSNDAGTWTIKNNTLHLTWLDWKPEELQTSNGGRTFAAPKGESFSLRSPSPPGWWLKRFGKELALVDVSTGEGDRSKSEVLAKHKSGERAELNEKGYRSVAKLKDNAQMELYIRRAVDFLGLQIFDEGGLQGFVPFYSGVKTAQNFERLMVELEHIAHSGKFKWVKIWDHETV